MANNFPSLASLPSPSGFSPGANIGTEEFLLKRSLQQEQQPTSIPFGDIVQGARKSAMDVLADIDALDERGKAQRFQQVLDMGKEGAIEVWQGLPPELQSQVPNPELLPSDPKSILGFYQSVDASQQKAKFAEDFGKKGFGERVTSGLETRVISPKEAISFSAAGLRAKGGKEDLGPLNARVAAAFAEFERINNRPANKQESVVIMDREDPEGKILGSTVGGRRISVAESGLALEKFSSDQQKRISDSIAKVATSLKDTIPIITSYNQLDKQLGGLFTDNPEKVIDDTFFDAIRAKLGASEDNPTIMAAFMNSILGLNPVNKAENELKRKIDTNENGIRDLMATTEFGKIIQPFAAMMNLIIKEQSGAAVTPSEFERLKNALGIDVFGNPAAFINGLRNYGEILRDKTLNFERGLTDKARAKWKRDGNGLLPSETIPSRGSQLSALPPAAVPKVAPGVAKPKKLKALKDMSEEEKNAELKNILGGQ